MLEGFEEYTPDIKDSGMWVVDEVAVTLKGRIGQKKAVTARMLSSAIKKKHGRKVGEPFIRKAIQYIRMKGMVRLLMSSSKGYYVAESVDEYARYVENSYKPRVRAMEATLAVMEKQIEEHERSTGDAGVRERARKGT